jgi:hypothetical protein
MAAATAHHRARGAARLAVCACNFVEPLIAARLAFLRERGLEYAVTHAREATSAPMLEHLGFETLFRGACYQLDC